MLIHPHSTTVTSHRELARLIDFAKPSAVPGGFGFLDRFGAVEKNRSPACFVTARMTYCFSIASLLGMPDVERYATHGVASLFGTFRDEAFGGYVNSLDGTPAAQRKRAYDTCFVALAASSAATAGILGGESLLEHVSDVLQARFWSSEAGALFESWDREFAEPGPDWAPMPEFNADNPRHEFHPYGMTPGHLFEWSRLLLQLESTFEQPPAWLREAAASLYETAVTHGWAADSKAGFVYTVDWNGRPVIRDRPHWVTAEAICAAATWTRLTGAPRYANHLQQWANFAQMHFIDTEHGSWHPLLDPNNRPSYTMWSGKPDIYHALQAVLLPQLPVAESTARAIMTAGNGS